MCWCCLLCSHLLTNGKSGTAWSAPHAQFITHLSTSHPSSLALHPHVSPALKGLHEFQFDSILCLFIIPPLFSLSHTRENPIFLVWVALLATSRFPSVASSLSSHFQRLFNFDFYCLLLFRAAFLFNYTPLRMVCTKIVFLLPLFYCQPTVWEYSTSSKLVLVRQCKHYRPTYNVNLPFILFKGKIDLRYAHLPTHLRLFPVVSDTRALAADPSSRGGCKVAPLWTDLFRCIPWMLKWIEIRGTFSFFLSHTACSMRGCCPLPSVWMSRRRNRGSKLFHLWGCGNISI